MYIHVHFVHFKVSLLWLMLRGPNDYKLLLIGENLDCVIRLSLYIHIKIVNLEKILIQYCQRQCLIIMGNNYLILGCGITQRKRES